MGMKKIREDKREHVAYLIDLALRDADTMFCEGMDKLSGYGSKDRISLYSVGDLYAECQDRLRRNISRLAKVVGICDWNAMILDNSSPRNGGFFGEYLDNGCNYPGR